MARASYTAKDITVLEGLEPVRKRPGMYIGSTGARGLHHLIYEVVANSVDEALAGRADLVEVMLHPDNSVTVRDNGSGIPTDIMKEQGLPAVTVVLTKLHAGGKFGGEGYKVSGGLHGVGVSVVNALSAWLRVEVKRDGKLFRQEFARGEPTSDLKKVGPAKDSGTTITFLPDLEVFDELEWSKETLIQHLRETAFLTKGLRIVLVDEREGEERHEFYAEGGIRDFVSYVNNTKDSVHKHVIYFEGTSNGNTVEHGEVEVAMQWNTSYVESIFSFANNINTHEGGSHLSGFKSALTRTLNDYARRNNLLKEKEENLEGEDVREGLAAVISLKLQDPQFEGQTKTKLGNPWVRGMVEQTVNGKLADCSINDPSSAELYLVEGNSAGGSATDARDRTFQAILPLRGKVINSEKNRINKVLSNAEIQSIITAIGTGIGDEFDLEKLRYHRIIVMTDADVDGSHIRTLILTFLYRQMQELVEGGYVYIAVPPLYRVKVGNREQYVEKESQFEDLLVRERVKDIEVAARGDNAQKFTQAKYARFAKALNEFDGWASRLRADFGSAPTNFVIAHRLVETELEQVGDLGETFEVLAENGHELSVVEQTPEGTRIKIIENETSAASHVTVPAELFASPVYAGLRRSYAQLVDVVGAPPFRLALGKKDRVAESFEELRTAALDLAKEGITISRFKGLGEMNPEELWETTMDPANRLLIQVEVEDAAAADRLFSMLMGDQVEPRREFIESNAKDVRFLDV